MTATDVDVFCHGLQTKLMTVYSKEGYTQVTATDVGVFGHGLQTHDSVYQRKTQTHDDHLQWCLSSWTTLKVVFLDYN